MRVALIAKDKPNSLNVRMDTRDAHVAYLKGSDAVEMAGPFLDENGDMCGSLIILNVDTMADAQAFADGDPYGHAGLFESVELTAWNKVLG